MCIVNFNMGGKEYSAEVESQGIAVLLVLIVVRVKTLSPVGDYLSYKVSLTGGNNSGYLNLVSCFLEVGNSLNVFLVVSNFRSVVLAVSCR